MSTSKDTNKDSGKGEGAGAGNGGGSAPVAPATPSQSALSGSSQDNDMSSPSTTRAAPSYGTIMTPEPMSTRSSQQSPSTEQTRTGLRPLEGLTRQRTNASESDQKFKKPPMARRTSSRYQAPHRGQEFSVDDDPEEYESDFQQVQSSTAKTATGYGSLKRQRSTVRRRPQPQGSGLSRVNSLGNEEEEAEAEASGSKAPASQPVASQEETSETLDKDLTLEVETPSEDDGDDEVSDAESFTLKDRQTAINQTHPFGIRIWKPALYKKNRSVEKTAEGDIHSSPGGKVDRWLWFFNLLWTLLFGWWLAIAAVVGAVACFLLSFTPGAANYGRVFWGLAGYLFYPFGKFVRLEQDEAYAEEDEGEGRSIGEYEQWQRGDIEDGRLFFGPPTSSRGLIGRRRASMDSADENDSLLGHARSGNNQDNCDIKPKRRLFGRGQWTLGRIMFYCYFYFVLTPLLLLVCGLCWLLVFSIPMGRVTMILFDHLRRHPLALSFHSDAAYSRGPSSSSSSVLLCTYRAVGLKYWKYTIDGTNIFLINLIGVVLFTIFDYWVLDEYLGLDLWIVQPGFVFALALFSVIPLAYFIGQAVASISAQSSMGLGAAINAFFSTIVEVFLYCVALQQGKGQLVEGSIIGSIFAGILFLPGISMCFGAIQRKTQRFNVKSAGVTSTMLLFAVIAAFGPTLFYQIYGSHELKCSACIVSDERDPSTNSDCRRCFYTQVPAVNDRFFIDAVQPYCWIAAVMLFLSYLIGLWFTLRTHAAVIWNNEPDEKKVGPALPNGSVSQPVGASQNLPAKQQSTNTEASNRIPIKDSQLYKRILGQSLRQVGLGSPNNEESTSRHASLEGPDSVSFTKPPFILPPKNGESDSNALETSSLIEGLTEEQNVQLARHMAEMAATAATVATRDATRTPRKPKSISDMPVQDTHRKPPSRPATVVDDFETTGNADAGNRSGGGHDAPNWSRLKSSVILLGATILYAVIAEILVNTVDVVLESVDIDEKFLGITLFALVPNTTEFLNAISFAMNGNIALSMEIGSAYALQVCLLQIPALVLFSALKGQFTDDPGELASHSFNLLFPQWDMITVILCVFLFSYVYGEGKSNYFKGSILCLTYFVIMVGFYLSGISASMDALGIDRFELAGGLSSQSFKTVGRGTHGRAY